MTFVRLGLPPWVAAMEELEDNVLLTWVCRRELWLLIIGVCCYRLNWCLRLGFKWVMGFESVVCGVESESSNSVKYTMNV